MIAMPIAKLQPPKKLSSGAGISLRRVSLKPIRAITIPVRMGLIAKLSPCILPG